ncbi:hypothetical protein P153DRAFT_369884 [Dothidotthia symphoricarpi CBS 119687]|uniref:Uncharacterized protein n=1 Tax=Dothidotthia symphoricarpi CBS 119687 TaxID=1392245 RepID=A0A6A6A438_9PLEO|nr:uncharacterized protein P153DRAFT_369884 [Dothidotthia symphoricarpi CBS 119687]KAF2125884.1 hypothetical protein P153DRAFT_369884 [Dothidotthia symphoricarpi CBS 119687]
MPQTYLATPDHSLHPTPCTHIISCPVALPPPRMHFTAPAPSTSSHPTKQSNPFQIPP